MSNSSARRAMARSRIRKELRHIFRPAQTGLLANFLPLLLESFHRHWHRRLQLLRKEGHPQLLNHPPINLQLRIVDVLLAMPLGALEISLPERANLGQLFGIAPRLSKSHFDRA